MRAPMVERRRFLAGAAATAGLAAVGGPTLLRRAGAQAAPPSAPRLAYGPDPARSMWLSWSTPGAVAGAVAELGLDDRLGLTLPIETRTVSGHPGVHYHHALIEGLEPSTTYTWQLRHAGADAVTGSLTTASVERVPFRFVTFGDQGDGAAALAVGSVIARLDPAPVLAFLVGDLSYASITGGALPVIPGVTDVDHATWDRWLELASSSGAARFPWLGGVGNHEMEPGQGELGYDGYLARVALPGNGPSGVPTAWTTRHGNVAFVNLDANDVSYEIAQIRGWTGDAQGAWLDATLAHLRADPAVDWIVVGFHHCAYCSNAVHASDDGVRQWEAVFDRHQVDLVVNGHNHCYERSHPMRAGAPVAEVGAGGRIDAAAGTTYVTAGGGGQTGYPTFLAPLSTLTVAGGTRIPELATWSAFRSIANSLAYVDVDPGEAGGSTTMTVVAVDSTGIELERVTLVRDRATSSPVVSPTVDPAVAAPEVAPERRAPAALPATGHGAQLAIAATAVGAAVAGRVAADRASTGS